MGSTGKRLPLSLRRPRTILGIALVLIVALGYVGRNVEGKLNPTSLDVPGTDANRANKMLHQYFGDSAPFAILLQGPPGAIDEQGPKLVHALRASDPKVTTVSPWDKGEVGNLRPAPNKALILADFHVGVQRRGPLHGRRTQRDPRRKVTPPVEATQTGFATLSRRDPGRIDRRHAPERADRAADPAARPAARLPLAGRGADPALLRGDHGDHLARRALAALLGDLDRRLRARR